MQDALLLERAAVLRGEWWRLWTGQLVHFGAGHLLWNLAVLVPAGVWAERLAPGRTRLLLALAPGVIGGGLLAFDPGLARYGGLSGLAAAVLALLALEKLAVPARAGADRWCWRAVLALLAVKLLAEMFAGSAVFARFASDEVRPVPLAHLVGVACAAAVFFIRRRRGPAAP